MLPNQIQGINGLGILPGLGLNMNAPQVGIPRTHPITGFVPGSKAHAAAFQMQGPDYEVKLFVGGLAF